MPEAPARQLPCLLFMHLSPAHNALVVRVDPLAGEPVGLIRWFDHRAEGLRAAGGWAYRM